MKNTGDHEQEAVDAMGPHIPERPRDTIRCSEYEEEALCSPAMSVRAKEVRAIANLVGSIAHEFNNILTPIIGYAEMSMDQAGERAAVHFYQKQILKSAKRARNLASLLVAVSRGEDEERAEKCIPQKGRGE